MAKKKARSPASAASAASFADGQRIADIAKTSSTIPCLDVSDPRPSTSRTDEMPTNTGGTVQTHSMSGIVSPGAETVRAPVSMTEWERKLTDEGERCAAMKRAEDCFVVQVAALNALLKKALCPQC